VLRDEGDALDAVFSSGVTLLEDDWDIEVLSSCSTFTVLDLGSLPEDVTLEEEEGSRGF
jgi:hypothetical protein